MRVRSTRKLAPTVFDDLSPGVVIDDLLRIQIRFILREDLPLADRRSSRGLPSFSRFTRVGTVIRPRGVAEGKEVHCLVVRFLVDRTGQPATRWLWDQVVDLIPPEIRQLLPVDPAEIDDQILGALPPDVRSRLEDVIPRVSTPASQLWLADIRLQEGPIYTGWEPQVSELFARRGLTYHSDGQPWVEDEDCKPASDPVPLTPEGRYVWEGTAAPPRFFNAVCRDRATLIHPNLGRMPAPVDLEVTVKTRCDSLEVGTGRYVRTYAEVSEHLPLPASRDSVTLKATPLAGSLRVTFTPRLGDEEASRRARVFWLEGRDWELEGRTLRILTVHVDGDLTLNYRDAARPELRPLASRSLRRQRARRETFVLGPAQSGTDDVTDELRTTPEQSSYVLSLTPVLDYDDAGKPRNLSVSYVPDGGGEISLAWGVDYTVEGAVLRLRAPLAAGTLRVSYQAEVPGSGPRTFRLSYKPVGTMAWQTHVVVRSPDESQQITLSPDEVHVDGRKGILTIDLSARHALAVSDDWVADVSYVHEPPWEPDAVAEVHTTQGRVAERTHDPAARPLPLAQALANGGPRILLDGVNDPYTGTTLEAGQDGRLAVGAPGGRFAAWCSFAEWDDVFERR